MDITWKVEALDTAPSLDGLSNVVVGVHWRANALDGDLTASIYGCAEITHPNEATDFTSYEALTESMVLSWLFDSDAPLVNKNKTEQALVALIDDKRTPLVVQLAPPWQ